MSYTPTEWESTDVVTAIRMNALEQAVGDMNMSYTPNTWSDGDILSAEKMNALEQAVASGGGGSSDFSTATVTVVNNTEFDPYSFDVPSIYEANELGEGSPAMIYNAMVCPLGESTHRVRLYKGLAYCTGVAFPSDATVSTTGDIVIDNDIASITGDCTITIS